MDERDELSGIFDGLRPEDFVLETTAIASMAGCYAGPDILDGFLEHQLNAVRLAFSMADGWLFTTAVLAGHEGLRTFVADDDETLLDFVARVRRRTLRPRRVEHRHRTGRPRRRSPSRAPRTGGPPAGHRAGRRPPE